MSDLIDRQAAIDAIRKDMYADKDWMSAVICDGIEQVLKRLPSAQEHKKDIIQKFHDYQIEWLKSHYDIELEPQLEEMIVRFLHDTANCYMMEVDNE